MTTIDKVRALFIEGGAVQCVDNTYKRETGDPRGDIGRVWQVMKVGKTVWTLDDRGFRGTFPERASDVLHVDNVSATWRIGRGEHTVTYRRVEA